MGHFLNFKFSTRTTKQTGQIHVGMKQFATTQTPLDIEWLHHSLATFLETIFTLHGESHGIQTGTPMNCANGSYVPQMLTHIGTYFPHIVTPTKVTTTIIFPTYTTISFFACRIICRIRTRAT